MKITRNIKRQITVTAAEVYQALAKIHDFPVADHVDFEVRGNFAEEVTLLVETRTEQEL